MAKKIGKLTREVFLERCKESYKTNSLYNYEDIIIRDDIKVTDRIEVICKKHGKYETTANRFMRGIHGCPECNKNKQQIKMSITQEEFIGRLLSIYGNKYDFSKTIYTGSRGSTTFKCYEHGDVTVATQRLLRGCGCKKCSWRARNSGRREESYKRFMYKLHEVYGNRYDLSKSEFTGYKNRMIMTCLKHGDFLVIPSMLFDKPKERLEHLEKCPHCSRSSLCSNDLVNELDSYRLNKGEVFSYKYFGNTHIPIEIECTTCGFSFNKYYHNIKNSGIRCPICCLPVNNDIASIRSCLYGGLIDVPTKLYVVRLILNSGENVYKIGVTTKSVRKRIVGLKVDRNKVRKVEEVSSVLYSNFMEAYFQEQRLLNLLSNHRYESTTLAANGNTELLTIDPTEFI